MRKCQPDFLFLFKENLSMQFMLFHWIFTMFNIDNFTVLNPRTSKQNYSCSQNIGLKSNNLMFQDWAKDFFQEALSLLSEMHLQTPAPPNSKWGGRKGFHRLRFSLTFGKPQNVRQVKVSPNALSITKLSFFSASLKILIKD